jgi:plasmid stabilization system protein ParE
MIYRVIIEPTAERGIRDAIRWIAARGSPAAAAKWYNGLVKKVSTLTTQPFRCPIAAENDKFPEEIRELLYGRRNNRFRIIFTVRDDLVLVLYVHHGARDEIEL